MVALEDKSLMAMLQGEDKPKRSTKEAETQLTGIYKTMADKMQNRKDKVGKSEGLQIELAKLVAIFRESDMSHNPAM